MTKPATTEAQLRIDLAAAFRWVARLNWHESIANHFSAAVSADGSRFLLNPNGSHFSRIRASELLLLDANDPASAEGPNAPDPTAWFLHSQLHRLVPRARCILHTHMPNATALCCLKDYEFLMLDQDACRYHRRIAYDRDYSGMALDASEGRRVAGLLGEDKSVLFMGNHGVMVIGATVAEAFDELYYLERAAAVQILALSTGRELALIPEDVAARTCAQWFAYPTEFSELHLRALKDILDQEEPGYKS
jgi:ribulose-5-phosphate 4-epimerase/fuculose-1-phosphate aldolase